MMMCKVRENVVGSSDFSRFTLNVRQWSELKLMKQKWNEKNGWAAAEVWGEVKKKNENGGKRNICYFHHQLDNLDINLWSSIIWKERVKAKGEKGLRKKTS